MNFEERISAFMDGALSPGEETEFLHILSVSPDKRALFHSYLDQRAAFIADARSTTVPSHLDMAVLGAAGVLGAGTAAAAASGSATGGSVAGGSVAGGSVAGKAGTGAAGMAAGAATSGTTGAGSMSGVTAASWWTMGRMLSALLLGVALFSGGYVLNDLLTPAQGTHAHDIELVATPVEENRITDASTEAVSPFNGVETNSGPVVANDTGTEEKMQEAATPHVVYRNVYITQIDTVYLPGERTTSAHETRAIKRIDTVVIAAALPPRIDRPINIVEQPRSSVSPRSSGRFEVELQREHLSTWPYIDYGRLGVDRTQQQFAVSLGYLFDERHSAGIIAGEKSFAMEYYRVENDSLFLFQRQPALFYGGGFYRYAQPLFSGVTPEVTLTLGGCDFGPVLGARLALRFDPLDRISLLIGANGTILAYRYRDKLFTSHSLGLSYGMRYRF
ncbi:MAG: hypothetical protein KFH87_03015 [Bacteroidetes bacterium]|nr:hypothetical protein [Bacteroidota bacterium]